MTLERLTLEACSTGCLDSRFTFCGVALLRTASGSMRNTSRIRCTRSLRAAADSLSGNSKPSSSATSSSSSSASSSSTASCTSSTCSAVRTVACRLLPFATRSRPLSRRLVALAFEHWLGISPALFLTRVAMMSRRVRRSTMLSRMRLSRHTAMCSGVLPLSSRTVTTAPRSHSCVHSCSFPCKTAWWRSVWPVSLSGMLMSAPDCTSLARRAVGVSLLPTTVCSLSSLALKPGMPARKSSSSVL
mmetsp:Transcript_45643/g.114204  ORF Transcript_45643/g.114204 Transcript_45643/m.114204 type:complete len:245 (-) Transcript_45643:1178-1912(-)